MKLYIDETENNKMFMVVGLLVNSKSEIDMSFKRFKNRINEIGLKPKDKQVICIEFKSFILDRKFQRIKNMLLNELNKLNYVIFYSCYSKNKESMKQSKKEKIYINLLEKIVDNIDNEVDIVFDDFGRIDFEDKIITRLSKKYNVKSVTPKNSQKEAGLKYVDNICSVIRLYRSNEDRFKFFESIKDNTIQI